MNKLFFVSALAICASANAAVAEGFYAGATLGSVELDVDDVEVQSTNLNALIGFEVNQTFAVESEFSFAVVEDEIDVDGGTVDASTNYAGIFAKASFPLSSEFSAHARLGFVNVTFEADGDGGSASADDSGVAIGAGAQYAVSPTIAIRGDATFADIDGVDLTTLTIGTVFSF
ncbi:opacity protein-like surface antigen [Yoonia maricola]|uniref:Opacity protein-like surface antigen n=2 Tax=Yoonia maricola TaxID=420999 RepID=A0A2M8W2P1_9RHOB|nr:opacity protein-like surface antigen [Yoonia maricola]